jgi:putative oxidoreductase
MRDMKYLVLIARLLIGGLFIYASVTKIPDPAGFSEAIRNYTILPPALTNLAGIMLPWIELAAGVLLVLGIETKAAALVTTGLMAIFVPALIYVYAIGLDISCGCFGGADSSGNVTLVTVIRDSSLLFVCLLILFGDRGHFSLLRAWKPVA